jgi:hypothetical protein
MENDIGVLTVLVGIPLLVGWVLLRAFRKDQESQRLYPSPRGERRASNVGACTFNGIGTTYYGACDFDSDGSYVTTQWFTFIYVPILPLHSVRLREGETRSVFMGSQTSLEGVSRVPLNTRQVLRVYAFVCGIFASILLPFPVNDFLIATGIASSDPTWDGIRVGGIASLGLIATLVTRWRVQKKAFARADWT